MTLGAALSIGGNIGNTLVVGSRYLHALASSGFGPRMLARVHPRFQMPAWAIVTQAVATLRNSSRLAASAAGFAFPVAPADDGQRRTPRR